MLYNWKNKSNKQKTKIILGNQKRYEDERSKYNDLWITIVSVFRPRRYDMLNNDNHREGERYGVKVYDQHPANSLVKFASGKVGYMVNRAVPWIQYVTPDNKFMNIDRVKEYLQNFAAQILAAAGRSNLYSALVPNSLDAESIGTAVLIPVMDERKDRVVYDTVHPNDSYIGVDRFGDVIIYHRILRLTRMTAEDMFGRDKLPKNWYQEGELKDILHKDLYIWAVYPNEDRDNTSKLNIDKEFITFAVLLGDTTRDDNLVYESGKDYFPICYRALRESGSAYGTSIASDCLTAALVANKLGEKSVDAAHKAVEPPTIASKSIGFNLKKNAGSTTWVDDINRDGVKTWQDRLNWPLSDAQMQRFHEQLDDRMFIRFFEMLSSGDIKNRTAYEVSQMMAEKATLMSTMIDTFEQEVLEPCLEVLIKEEERAGRLPDPPPEIYEVGGQVDTRFLGPLEQLQRSLLRSRGTIDALSIIQQMMQMNEQVGWVFDWSSMAEDVTVAQGMPQKHILSPEAQKEIAQEVARQQQQQQQLAAIETAGKAAPGLGSTPEPGSPAEALLEAQEAAA